MMAALSVIMLLSARRRVGTSPRGLICRIAPRNSSIGATENVDDFEGGTAFGKKGLNRG